MGKESEGQEAGTQIMGLDKCLVGCHEATSGIWTFGKLAMYCTRLCSPVKVVQWLKHLN
jgi:hypothetical protein